MGDDRPCPAIGKPPFENNHWLRSGTLGEGLEESLLILYTLNVGHDDVGHALFLAIVVNGDDARVLHQRHRFHFSLKTTTWEELGWKSTISYEEGIPAAIRWYEQNAHPTPARPA
jgi:hypothetical protein